jgi:S1-C subfamily serine protease
MSDTRFPQRRMESYEVKSDRITKLMLSIMSQSDGTLTGAILQEMLRFAPRQTAPTYGRLGVRIQQVTEDIAASKKLTPARGALVTEIDDTGAAKAAGIQVGDVIIKMDDKDIADMRDLPRIAAETPADKRVDVAVIRDGEERMFSVTLRR